MPFSRVAAIRVAFVVAAGGMLPMLTRDTQLAIMSRTQSKLGVGAGSHPVHFPPQLLASPAFETTVTVSQESTCCLSHGVVKCAWMCELFLGC